MTTRTEVPSVANEQVFSPGTKVRWFSQSGGSWTEKIGTVIAHLPPNSDAVEALNCAGFSGKLMGQRISLIERYLVRVQVGPRSVRFSTLR